MTATDDDIEGMPLLKASILVVLLFQICALFFRQFGMNQLEAKGIAHLIAKDLSWLLVPIIFATLMIPVTKRNWPALKAQFQFRHLKLRLILTSIALGITLRLAVWGGLVTNASFQILTSSTPGSVIGPVFGFSCLGPSALVLTILVTVVLTPLLEETVNRGFFLQTMLSRGRWQAILFSSLLFGIFHHQESIVISSIAGIFLAMQFLNSETLWASTITHATYNAIVIFDWSCVHTVWNPVEISQAIIAVGALSSALLLVSLILAAFLSQEKCYQ